MQTELPGLVKNTSKPRAIVAKVPLQVRIPENIRRQFKVQAARRGLQANDFFVEVWEFYAARALESSSLGENS